MLAACGGGPVSDPGTGTGTLFVDADMNASSDTPNATQSSQFATDFHVRVQLNGADVTTGTVTVSDDSGSTSLVYDGTNGNRWHGTQNGYTGQYTLDIESGTNKVEGVVLTGPDVHVFTAPTGTAAVDATKPLEVDWTRGVQADEATIQTNKLDRVPIPDSGTFMIPVGGVDSDATATKDDDIVIVRTSTIAPAGAIGGSQVRVSVENHLPIVVAPTGP
jgi:hypothetical protein